MLLPLLRRLFRDQPAPDPAHPRLLAYCAANVGAGPLLRLTRVLGELKARRPEVSILIATDAAETGPAERIGAAVLRLPRFQFVTPDGGKERPLHVRLKNREFAQLRSALLLAAGRGFAPDLIHADTNPHGKRDELLPLLRAARRGQVPVTLMMRDIPAMPEEPFKLRGAMADILRHAGYYQRLMIAGDPLWFDAAQTYLWPAELQTKLRYAGFVVPEAGSASRAEVLAPWAGIDPARPLVVASCGGGWRADLLIPALLAGMRALRQTNTGRLSEAQLVAFVGNNAAAEELTAWRSEAEALGGIALETFSPGFEGVLRHAEVAIIQAGSTLFQVLEGEQPLVLLTREYKSSEQAERARRAALWPGVRVEAVEAVNGELAREWLAWGLLAPRVPRRTGYGFDGAQRAARVLEDLLPR